MNSTHSFEWTYELRFAVALVLGFLIGLERESASSERKFQYFAGVRTYTIISLYGFGCGWLHTIGVSLALPVGILSITALAVVGYLAKLKEGRMGATSEVSALLTFLMGTLTLLADVWVAMSLGIVSTILLSEKAELERYVERLDKSEFLAVLKFILVTVIILPVLPNQEYSYFKLNPTRIWQVIIMVSTIGFVGYFLMKKFGERFGLWLSGLLGGIVSSTAVSIAMARIARRHPERAGNALQAAILASSMMYLRILVLVWIMNVSFLPYLWWRMLLLAAIGASMVSGIRTHAREDGDVPAQAFQNPFEIRPAILFGVIFVGVSVGITLARDFFGQAGILVLSFITGVYDIDPFILSIIQRSGDVEKVLLSAIIIATMSNTIVKGVYYAVLSKGKRRECLLRFGVWAVLHLPLIFF